MSYPIPIFVDPNDDEPRKEDEIHMPLGIDSFNVFESESNRMIHHSLGIAHDAISDEEYFHSEIDRLHRRISKLERRLDRLEVATVAVGSPIERAINETVREKVGKAVGVLADQLTEEVLEKLRKQSALW